MSREVDIRYNRFLIPHVPVEARNASVPAEKRGELHPVEFAAIKFGQDSDQDRQTSNSYKIWGRCIKCHQAIAGI
jgi:hypothetical protein